jgi:predicted MFS family arabinose efflux permease
VSRDESLAVWLLSVGLLLIYAGVFYAFPAVLPDLLHETGWSKGDLALGPTLSYLVMAGLTPLTGRVVDRGHGGALVVVMPVVAALGLVALAFVRTRWEWWAVWAVLGVAQSGCLYESVFALMTRRLGIHARIGITRITLVAGLSSTMTFPLGHWLGATFGGQRAYLGFAALALFGTIPLNILAMRLLRGPEVARVQEDATGALRAAMKRPAFWGIAVIFALIWLNHGMLLTFILPLFQERGVSLEWATVAAACLGPSQLIGRMVLVVGDGRVSNAAVTKGALALVVVAAVVLWLAGAAPWMVFLVVAAQGAGAGLMSIMRPILIADVLGRRGFGAISGAAAVSPIVATAVAPTLGAFLLDQHGPAAIYGALVLCAVVGFGLGLMLVRRRPVGG